MTESKSSGGTGHCLCGAVQYRYEGEPLTIGVCQCDRCQRQSGSAFLIGVIFPRDAVTIVGKLTTYESRLDGKEQVVAPLLSNLRIGSFNYPGPISRNSLDDGRDPGRQDRDQPSFQRLVFGWTTLDNHAGRCCVLRRLPRRHVWRVTQASPRSD